MNIKDLIIPLGLALVTTWAIQNIFLGSGASWRDHNDHRFTASKKKPLNTEVEFIDEKRPGSPAITVVDTDWGRLTFSTQAASLERLEFKRSIGDKIEEMTTIYPLADTQKEERCFLLAFDCPAPYYYQLIADEQVDKKRILQYQSISTIGEINKTFTIDQQLCKIDLKLGIKPPMGIVLEPRLFYPSPILPLLADTDTISAIVMYGENQFEKIGRDRLAQDRGWFDPSLFGTDNRYFIHAMIADNDGFVQRAYYKFLNKKDLMAIIEGPLVHDKKEWNFSFYFGPKESEYIDPVDNRLEKTLDYYSWFAPIARFLLAILRLLYSYLHNYGLAIIVLTCLIKLILLPFTIRGEQGAKKRIEIQKKLAYIQQRYKDNPEILARERAELIREHGLPGLGGCLPLLIQLPIFFVLSRVLANALELYQAPMLWITDLSSRDPYYILPIFILLVMLAQAMMADQQHRMSMIAMAFVFGAISSSFSAGLALYIGVSTLLSVMQTYLVKHLNWER